MMKVISLLLFVMNFWSLTGYCGNEHEAEYLIRTDNNEVLKVNQELFRTLAGRLPLEADKTFPAKPLFYQKILGSKVFQNHTPVNDNGPSRQKPDSHKPETKQKSESLAQKSPNPFDPNAILNSTKQIGTCYGPSLNPSPIQPEDESILSQLFDEIGRKFTERAKALRIPSPFMKPTPNAIREILAFLDRHRHQLRLNQYIEMGEKIEGEPAPCGIQLIPSEDGFSTEIVLYPRVPVFAEGGFKEMRFALGLNRDGGRLMAVTRPLLKGPEKTVSEKTLEGLKREYLVHKELQGSGIVALPHVAENAYVFTQKLYESDLFQYLNSKEGKQATPEEKIDLALNFFEGAILIYRKGFIHRDIKPENILIDENGHASIGDFGTTTPLGNNDKSMRGTKMYNAPEDIINGRNDQSRKTDSWALGMTLVDLFYGNKAWRYVPKSEIHNVLKNIHSYVQIDDHFAGMGCRHFASYLNVGDFDGLIQSLDSGNSDQRQYINALICGLINPNWTHRLTLPRAYEELRHIKQRCSYGKCA